MSRSSRRLSRGGFFCVVVALLGFPLTAPVHGQDVLEHLNQAFRDWMEAVKASAEESARIALARDRFARATDGQATEAAWKELEELLTRKDELYLFFAVIMDEPEKRALFRERGSIPLLAASGDIDGGIPGPARAAFAQTVTDMRAELMKDPLVKKFDGPLPLPHQLYQAKDRCKQQWSVYELRRNRLEYHRAGKPMPPLSDPRPFLIWALQSQLLSFDEASNAYDALAAAVGEETMQQTVAAVAESSQDIRGGHLTREELAHLGLIASTDVPKDQDKVVGGKITDGRTVVWGTRPLSVLRGLWARDNPRVAAMFALGDALRLDPAMAWRRLTMIEAAVGKQRLETAVAELHAAPRRAADGMLVKPVSPGDQLWMHRPFEKLKEALLAGDDAKAQVRYFIAMDLIVSAAEGEDRVATDLPVTAAEGEDRVATDLPVTAAEGEDLAAVIDRRYQELAGIKGESELLASAQKLRAVGWQPRSAAVATNRVVAALEKMLGLKGELNPHFLQWAGFGPGTTATYELEIHRELAPGAPGGVLKKKREVRVIAATHDAVVLRRIESEQQRDGSWQASPPTTETIPAYQEPLPPGQGSLPFLSGGWLGFDHLGPEIDRQETASILIENEVIDCTRSIWSGPREQPQTFERRQGHPLMGSNMAEVWSNSRVPGWITKAVYALPNSVTVVRLAAFDVKPAGEKLAANAARERESLAWMRPYEALDRIDPELRGLDVGSRAWASASVGSSVTHRFHYKGPSRQRSSQEEELSARVVSTLIEKDRDAALVRFIFKRGDEVIERKQIELGSAETHYVGNLVTWMASNRDRPRSFVLAGDVARTTVNIDGQPVECINYQHVPLAIPGKQLRAERLIVSESIPGAIVYLSVRSDPGTGGVPTALTYALEGLDQENLPEPAKLVVKPKGGNFAVDQELMVDRHGNGKWERGKILRFEQLPNNAGGRYLIRIGRNPTWHDEDWLREHSRPVPEGAEGGEDAPPPARTPGAATPARTNTPGAEAQGGTPAVGSKVRFLYGGKRTPVEGTVIKFHGEGPQQRALVEFVMPGRQRTRGEPTADRVLRDWVRTSELELSSESP